MVVMGCCTRRPGRTAADVLRVCDSHLSLILWDDALQEAPAGYKTPAQLAPWHPLHMRARAFDPHCNFMRQLRQPVRAAQMNTLSPYQGGELAESYGVQWVGTYVRMLREHIVSGFQTKKDRSTHSDSIRFDDI